MNWGKVFLSAGCAFGMAVLVALLIETFGGAVGSVIGTVPSTILPSVYIILTEERNSIQDRVDSTLTCIFGMFATDILFMPTWKFVPKRLPKKWSNCTKVIVTTIVGVVFWFIGAFGMTLIQQFLSSLGVSLWISSLGTLILTAIFGICLCWHLPPTPSGKNKVKWYIHLSRGIAASVFIFISGVLSQSGAGTLAGLMTTFPAIFATTMISVSLAQGAEVSTGAIGPLIMGGMSVGWFSIFAAFCFSVLHLHAGWCITIAWVLSVLFWSIPVYYFVSWRRDVTAKITKKMVEEATQECEIEMKKIEGKEEPTVNEQNGITEEVVPPTELHGEVLVPEQDPVISMPASEKKEE